MNFELKLKKRNFDKTAYSDFVLGVDIGGTNSRFGVFGVKNDKISLLFSVFFKSPQLTSIVPAINKTLEIANKKYKIKITKACLGVAGPISAKRDFSKLTNVRWSISKYSILKSTNLNSVYIINDFEAIGYGINMLKVNGKDIVKIMHKPHKHKEQQNQTKAIIGAGTGLGQSILHYENYISGYVPIPSEGGHSDFPIKDDLELKFLKFVKKIRKTKKSINYEEVLSGRGIEVIYMFLKSLKMYKVSKYSKKIDSAKDKTPLIGKYRKVDETCKATFKLYAKFYARILKNFALNTLCRGGIYVAGGIASRYKEIFHYKEFISEFEDVLQISAVIKNIPIYIIYNTDVGLLGAGFAAVNVK